MLLKSKWEIEQALTWPLYTSIFTQHYTHCAWGHNNWNRISARDWPRAIRNTRMIRIMVGLIGREAFKSISSRMIPITDKSTIARSSWFHLQIQIEIAGARGKEVEEKVIGLLIYSWLHSWRLCCNRSRWAAWLIMKYPATSGVMQPLWLPY